MYSIAVLLAMVSLVSADRIVFPESSKKGSTASKGDPPALDTKSTSETKPRSFFGPSAGSFGQHDGLNHHGDLGPLPFGAPGTVDSPYHLEGGDFPGGAQLSGGFGRPGFNIPPPPPHGPHGSHFGGLGVAGSHSPFSSLPHGGLQTQHIGPVIPVTDPLSANLGGNPGGFPVSGGCRFWCRTPKNQVYCCEDANAPQNPVGVKAGVCPAARPACPPTRSLGPPPPCSNDGSCVGVDKCCYDTCLKEHTCKPPQGFGR